MDYRKDKKQRIGLKAAFGIGGLAPFIHFLDIYTYLYRIKVLHLPPVVGFWWLSMGGFV